MLSAFFINVIQADLLLCKCIVRPKGFLFAIIHINCAVDIRKLQTVL